MVKKNFIKKITASLLVTMMASSLLILSGCNSSNSNNSENSSQNSESVSTSEDILKEPETLETIVYNVAEKVVSSNQQQRTFRQIGRTFISESDDKVLRCDFTCTGIAFNAICKGAVRVKFWTNNDCYFTVYIDGVRVAERLFVGADDSNSFLTVANFEEYGQREIRLVKQSQYPFAYCGIADVEITGSFGKRPAQKDRFIEYYGDSILNGSNIYKGGTSVTSTDGTLSFGYMSALALNADCNIIGRGGMGLYAKDSATEGMNEIWNLTSSAKAPGVQEYDFSKIPDVVVVELGCNDVLSSRYMDARYKEAIGVMIDNIRSAYGNEMKIIWCYGYNDQMDEKWETLVKPTLDALNTYGTILYCELPTAPLDKSLGGDGLHPDVEIAGRMATAMAEFIEENIYA